jgi:antitoxin (DNA-binding transcriptional repressor) of toxin-antitoxin stability system
MDNMTTYGHDEVMKAVKIASLKAQLSRHLREVRAGQIVTVLDREQPVARLVPIDDVDDVVVTRPAANAPPIGRVRIPPSRKRLAIDVVGLLVKDRRRSR